MDDAIIRKIKQVVSANFNNSCGHYQDFEEKHGFFAALTLKLAALAGVGKGSQVLDIGCGNGASAAILSRELECEVLGFDLSPGMIEQGRQLIHDSRVRLEVGDAATPETVTKGKKFDAALYNAAIFIIPDAEKSLRAAAACLKPEGSLGFSFYPQILAADGSELFPLCFERCALPRPKAQVVTSYEKALQGLQQCCREVIEGSWEFPYTESFLCDFFSIPAQSASLFPRLDYEERRQLVPKLFAALQAEAATTRIVWRLAAGRI